MQPGVPAAWGARGVDKPEGIWRNRRRRWRRWRRGSPERRLRTAIVAPRTPGGRRAGRL